MKKLALLMVFWLVRSSVMAQNLPALSQPGDAKVIEGSSMGFLAAVISPYAPDQSQWQYQWRKDGIDIANGGNISGADTILLAITNVSYSDAGGYDMVVSGSFGSVTSTLATATIFSPAPPTALATRSNGVTTITWDSVPDATYQVEYTTDLVQPNWNALGSAVNPISSTASVSDAAGSDPQRFYRVAFRQPVFLGTNANQAGSSSFVVTVDASDAVYYGGGVDDAFFMAKYRNGQPVWTLHPTNKTSRVMAMATDADGSIAVLGFFKGRLEFDSLTLTGTNILTTLFVAKYSANGAALWAKKLPLSIQDFGAGGIAFDRQNPNGQNDIVVCGNFSYDGDFGGGVLTNHSSLNKINGGDTGADMFLAKYNAAGDHLWSKSFGSIFGSELASSVAVDSAGNIFMTGSFCGTNDFGGGPLVARGTLNFSDIFIAKFAANGAPIWSERFGGDYWDYSYALALDGQGNLFITGHYHEGTIDLGSGDLPTSGPSTHGGFFVAKYLGANGQHVWSKVTSLADDGLAYGRGFGLAITSTGDPVITGYFAQHDPSKSPFAPYFGGTTGMLAKYSRTDGSLLNARTFTGVGGTGVNEGLCLAIDSKGNMHVVGKSTTAAFISGPKTLYLPANDFLSFFSLTYGPF